MPICQVDVIVANFISFFFAILWKRVKNTFLRIFRRSQVVVWFAESFERGRALLIQFEDALSKFHINVAAYT